MGIHDIPNELLLLIVEKLSIVDLSRFLLTCRRLWSLLTPYFHELGVQDIGIFTALQWAADRGHASLAEIVIQRGADIDKPGRGQWGRTPLHVAAMSNHPMIIRLLVTNGANISARDTRHFTPLHYAAMCKPGAEMIRLLLQLGAEIMCGNEFVDAPPFFAAECGSVACMKVFVDAGFDLTTRGLEGRTILHHAFAGNGRKGMVRYLLAQEEAKLLVNVRDCRGIALLACTKNTKNLMLLLRLGASLGLERERWETRRMLPRYMRGRNRAIWEAGIDKYCGPDLPTW